jgi:O-antigen/teichoic acid export membrane protein
MSRWSFEGSLDQISNGLSKAFSFALVLAVPVVIGGFVLGDLLLYYLYGSDFVSGTPSLFVLLVTQVAIIFVMLQITCLNAMDKPKLSFISTSIAAVLNIVLNVLLIPVMGIVGAAIATLISLALNAVIAYFYLSKEIIVSLESKHILYIIISAALMGIAVVGFRLGIGITSFLYLIVAVILGGAVYFSVLFSIDSRLRKEIDDLLRTLGVL